HAILRTLNQSGEDEGRHFIQIWRGSSLELLKTCVGGALVAHLAALTSRVIGWETVLLTGPAVYLVYRTYILYLHRLADGKLHAEEMAALHLRTIEALALAIDA